MNGTATLDETLLGNCVIFILFYFSSLGACPFVDRLAAVHRDLDEQRRKKDSASSFARSNRGCKPGSGDRGWMVPG